MLFDTCKQNSPTDDKKLRPPPSKTWSWMQIQSFDWTQTYKRIIPKNCLCLCILFWTIWHVISVLLQRYKMFVDAGRQICECSLPCLIFEHFVLYYLSQVHKFLPFFCMFRCAELFEQAYMIFSTNCCACSWLWNLIGQLKPLHGSTTLNLYISLDSFYALKEVLVEQYNNRPLIE